jgi:putative transposase
VGNGTGNPKNSDGLLGKGERVLIYRFIDAEKANYPVRILCRVLDVPQSSYFDWNHHGRLIAERRAEADAVIVAEIRVVHGESDGTYGAVKIHDQLCKRGRRMTRRRVAELMHDNGIYGVCGREPGIRTTVRDDCPFRIPDLVERRFQPCRPDVVWYSDITYIWVAGGFWFLATVIDAATKQVVGWAFADHMRTGLVTAALHAAVRRWGNRIRAGIIFHSDRGSQYTSSELGDKCSLYRMKQSMGRTGVCWDSAGAESFFATLN